MSAHRKPSYLQGDSPLTRYTAALQHGLCAGDALPVRAAYLLEILVDEPLDPCLDVRPLLLQYMTSRCHFSLCAAPAVLVFFLGWP